MWTPTWLRYSKSQTFSLNLYQICITCKPTPSSSQRSSLLSKQVFSSSLCGNSFFKRRLWDTQATSVGKAKWYDRFMVLSNLHYSVGWLGIVSFEVSTDLIGYLVHIRDSSFWASVSKRDISYKESRQRQNINFKLDWHKKYLVSIIFLVDR